MLKLKHTVITSLILLLFLYSGTYASENKKDFKQSLENLKSPKQEMLDTGICKIRIGDKFFNPYIVSDIIPTDQFERFLPETNAIFSSSDENIASVNTHGLITAKNNGKCEIKCTKDGKDYILNVCINDKFMPLGARNLVYIGKREYLNNEMKRLEKYNIYAQWYYKKRKEVGWCSVFASYCVNSAGIDSYKYNTIPIDQINKYSVFGLLEGQVGHQWDGYSSVDRFTNIPKPGYFVIYGNRKNGYKYTHVGLVVDVMDINEGKYIIKTVEGNMSNTVKNYCYVYDSNVSHPKANMSELDKNLRTDLFPQYALHTDYWYIFGFCATWEQL